MVTLWLWYWLGRWHVIVFVAVFVSTIVFVIVSVVFFVHVFVIFLSLSLSLSPSMSLEWLDGWSGDTLMVVSMRELAGARKMTSLWREDEKKRDGLQMKNEFGWNGNIKLCYWGTEANFLTFFFLEFGMGNPQHHDKSTLVDVANQDDTPDSCKEHPS